MTNTGSITDYIGVSANAGETVSAVAMYLTNGTTTYTILDATGLSITIPADGSTNYTFSLTAASTSALGYYIQLVITDGSGTYTVNWGTDITSVSGGNETFNFNSTIYEIKSGTTYYKNYGVANFSYTSTTPTYIVTFNLVNLNVSTSLSLKHVWGVRINSSTSFTSASISLQINNVPNGTYSFEVQPPYPYTINPTFTQTTFTVNGANVTITVPLIRATYAITLSDNTLIAEPPVHIIADVNGEEVAITEPTSLNFAIYWNDGVTVTNGGSTLSYTNPVRLPAYNITADRRINQASTLSFTVPYTYGNKLSTGTSVMMYYLGKLVFAGYVRQITKHSTMEYDIYATDNLWNAALAKSGNIGIEVGIMIQNGLPLYQAASSLLAGTGLQLNNLKSEITENVHFGFLLQNDIITNVLFTVLTFNNYYYVVSTSNYINAYQYAHGSTSVTLVENTGGSMIKKRIIDNTYQYNSCSMSYVMENHTTTWRVYNTANGQIATPIKHFYLESTSIYYGDGDNVKRFNIPYLAIYATSNAPAYQFAQQFVSEFQNGWQYAVWYGKQYFDVSQPVNYTIEFADGVVWNNLTCIRCVVSQNGVETWFANVDAFPFQFLAAASTA